MPSAKDDRWSNRLTSALVFKKRPMKSIYFYFKKILTNEISAKRTFYPGMTFEFCDLKLKCVGKSVCCVLLCCLSLCCVCSPASETCGPADNCEGVRLYFCFTVFYYQCFVSLISLYTCAQLFSCYFVCSFTRFLNLKF